MRRDSDRSLPDGRRAEGASAGFREPGRRRQRPPRLLPPAQPALLCFLGALLSLAAVQPTTEGLADERTFTDLTEETGLDFVYDNGAAGEYYFPEITGGGVAFLDFDGDGLLDLYLVQGGRIGPEGVEGPLGAAALGDRLLRGVHRVRPDGSVEVRWQDVTERAGIRATGYGMGVAVGDVTGNGCPDLYLTNFGPNQLWQNDCDGTFTDITEASGTGDPSWGTSASFADLTGNGLLDLFVTNYVIFSLADNVRCVAPFGARDYCGPLSFPPAPDRLYLNRGDGTFEDASEPSGIARALGPGLGVIVGELAGDGRQAIYVANDQAPNALWVRGEGGRFADESLMAGVAVNREGAPEASMGIDSGDLTGNGLEDLFLTHLNGETNTLYLHLGGGLYEDRTAAAGLGAPSLPFTGFGTAFVDLDNDGWLDIAAVNGDVRLVESQYLAGEPFPFRQRNQLFRNLGEGRFVELQEAAGPAFDLAEVSRGLAAGDFDNDGAVDLLVGNLGSPARLLRNTGAAGAGWMGVALEPSGGPAHALGAVVEVTTSEDQVLRRTVRTDGSYLSARDPRVVVGLGAGGRPLDLRVRWPNGGAQRLVTPPAGRYLVIREPVGGQAP